VKFNATYSVPAQREKVFALLTDPAVLQRCIAGCEKMERTAQDHYNAHLKIGVAGLKGSYVGQVQLQDKRAPESYKLLMDGKGGPGFVKGSGHIQLTDKGPQTDIRCDAEVQVSGMIAVIGSRLVEAMGKKTMDDFFKKFADEVSKQ
jgi:carbon monoxide dehydrogenase subunit G